MEDEERFRDLSFKDKVLTIIMTIVLVLFYLITLLVFVFVFIPLRFYLWNDINVFLLVI